MSRRMPMVLIALLALLALLVLPLSAAAADCYEDVEPTVAAERIERSEVPPIILDVRTEGEFTGRGGHIEGALLIPLDQLQEAMPRLEALSDREVIVVCRSGNRSSFASMMLCDAGFSHVANLAGGMTRWQTAGLPVVHD